MSDSSFSSDSTAANSRVAGLPIFFVSDHTGITAEAAGRSLMARFPNITWNSHLRPFVEDLQRVQKLVEEINHFARQTQRRPIVFSTIVHQNLTQLLAESNALVINLHANVVPLMEAELGVQSQELVGGVHNMGEHSSYERRVAAIQFALDGDDGSHLENCPMADLILLGVSRAGKTPTSLYLAVNHGKLVVNYPLTSDDFISMELPIELSAHRKRIVGLTIDPLRLHTIRQQRLNAPAYADLQVCRDEIGDAMEIYRRNSIPVVDTTHLSIEEVAVKAMQLLGLE